MITEFVAFVLFVLLLAVSGYAMFLQSRLVRIEDKINRANKSVSRHKAKVSEWIAYADYLESELSRYSVEYAGVRLDYDIARGKVKAAPIKANGTKAFALTLPGMAIPADCEVLFDESPESIGALVVNRKPDQKSAKNGDNKSTGDNKTVKSEKAENSPDSGAKSSNGAKSEKRELATVIVEVGQAVGDTLSESERKQVENWLSKEKTSHHPSAKYAEWLQNMRKNAKK